MPPRRRTLAVALLGLFPSLELLAEKAPAMQLYAGLELGMEANEVRELLLSRGMLVKRKSYRAEEGMVFGLIGQPAVLSLLNRHKIDHSLLEGIPETGPMFLHASTKESSSIFGFVDRKLETYAYTLPSDQLMSSASPFSVERLAPLRDTLAALQDGCRYFSPLDRDKHGNVYSWSGERCRGGNLKVEYSPGTEEMLTVLVHP
jgi:hypothetical protein